MKGHAFSVEGCRGTVGCHAEGDRSEEAKKRILSSGTMDSAGWTDQPHIAEVEQGAWCQECRQVPEWTGELPHTSHPDAYMQDRCKTVLFCRVWMFWISQGLDDLCFGGIVDAVDPRFLSTCGSKESFPCGSCHGHQCTGGPGDCRKTRDSGDSEHWSQGSASL